MAAIDKIYLIYKDYLDFKDWCEKQPPLYDKYNKKAYLTDYLFKRTKEWDSVAPVFSAPYFVDAYIIRNCPIESVQKELMLRYGYWSQKRIKEFYNNVINWQGDDFPYWAKKEDFITLEDGTITIKGLEKSDYENIIDRKLYISPKRNNYEYGKHFRCTKHPVNFYNCPFRCGRWFVSVDVPDDSMWYHDKYNSWDFSDEFVVCDWSSSTASVKTIKALKRLMLKWKLPIGTKVRATGRYTFDNYEFVITK